MGFVECPIRHGAQRNDETGLNTGTLKYALEFDENGACTTTEYVQLNGTVVCAVTGSLIQRKSGAVSLLPTVLHFQLAVGKSLYRHGCFVFDLGAPAVDHVNAEFAAVTWRTDQITSGATNPQDRCPSKSPTITKKIRIPYNTQTFDREIQVHASDCSSTNITVN